MVGMEIRQLGYEAKIQLIFWNGQNFFISTEVYYSLTKSSFKCLISSSGLEFVSSPSRSTLTNPIT